MNISAEPTVSPTRTAMTIGAAAAALMLIVVNLPGLQMLQWVVFMGGVYYGMRRFRKETGNHISYFKALFVGVQTSFFTSVIIAFVIYFITKLNPELIDLTIDASEKILQTYDIPSMVVETTMQQWREILTPGLFAFFALSIYTVIGCFAAFIGAFFVQNAQYPNHSLNS